MNDRNYGKTKGSRQGNRTVSSAITGFVVLLVVAILSVGPTGQATDTPAGLKSFCRWFPSLCSR